MFRMWFQLAFYVSLLYHVHWHNDYIKHTASFASSSLHLFFEIKQSSCTIYEQRKFICFCFLFSVVLLECSVCWRKSFSRCFGENYRNYSSPELFCFLRLFSFVILNKRFSFNGIDECADILFFCLEWWCFEFHPVGN